MHTGLGYFSALDWFLFAVLLFSTIRAAMRGMVRELFWLVGTLFGLIAACEFYDAPAPFLQTLTRSRPLAQALSFLLIVFVVMFLAALLGKVLSTAARFAGLGWLDSVAGGIFGLLRGLLLLSAGMMAVAAFLPSDLSLNKNISGSVLAPYFLQAAHGVSSFVPVDMEQRVNSGLKLISSHLLQNQQQP